MKIGIGIKVCCRVRSYDKDGNLLDTVVVKHNDTLSDFKRLVGEATVNGSILCARRIRIMEGATVVDTQIASLTAGGTGLVNTFTKSYTFTNTGSVDYDIDIVRLHDYQDHGFCQTTLGASVSFPVGGTLAVDYQVTFTDWTSGSYPGAVQAAWTYELAECFGTDADTDTIDCGGADGGDIKITYTGGASSPKTETCSFTGGTSPTDTTDAMNKFGANFTDAADSAITLTQVDLIATDGTTIIAQQTANFDPAAGPYDLTAGGGLDIEFQFYVSE